jgi:hypothetical protein
MPQEFLLLFEVFLRILITNPVTTADRGMITRETKVICQLMDSIMMSTQPR